MQITIRNCRQSFANTRTPYVPKEGPPKFTFSGICSEETTISFISPTNGEKKTLPHTAMEKIIDKMCKDKWGKTPAKLERFVYNNADVQVGSRGTRRDEDGDFYDGYDEDTMFFSAGTKVSDAPEGLLIIDQKRKVLPASSGHPVNGDYVTAIINVFLYENDGKKGVSASIEGVQYLKKGDPFGASKVEATAFDEEELEDEEEVDDTDLEEEVDDDDI